MNIYGVFANKNIINLIQKVLAGVVKPLPPSHSANLLYKGLTPSTL
jgi:hypothetical protein